MPQAHVDPDELERFAGDLKTFIEELTGLTGHVQNQFYSLSESWQDQEQRRFDGEFSHFVSAIQRFSDQVEPMIPYLNNKAAHVRDYLGS